MSYVYDQRKRPQGPQNAEQEHANALGTGLSCPYQAEISSVSSFDHLSGGLRSGPYQVIPLEIFCIGD